ncbi:uncharacterized protein LOC135171015 [Diachasmimorpha longicaudata]|uniref:uncharacterized protein LOC135171015 n=1 Tax=Diachasmimorpha longicaudata TaxID=58733 RepID=UPI0030B8DC61
MKTTIVLFILSLGLVNTQGDGSDEAEVVDAFPEDSDETSEEGSNIICGPNERYSQCNANPLCQRTCERLGDDAIPCPREGSQKSCIEGCVCVEDYVRTQFYGPCVHNNRCPRVRH